MIRIFKNVKFIKPCPICKTKKKGDGILIAINGKEKGNICEAELFHIKCIELRFHQEKKIIAQSW